MAFPADLADPDPVAAPAFPDGPRSPRAARVVPVARADPSGVPADLADLVAPEDLVAQAVPVARVGPADPVAADLVGPAARAAPRDLTTAARPLPRPRSGWPRRRGAAPPA